MTGHRQAVGAADDVEHCPLMANYGAPTVTLVEGRGTEVWDSEGKRYLDFLCGLAVTNLGHSHPAVTKAICDQAGRLIHASNLYNTVPGPRLAVLLDRLVRAAPSPNDVGRAADATAAGHTEPASAAGPTSEAAVMSAAGPTDSAANAESQSGQVLFQNSGAEANEAAIKLARKYNGRGRHVVLSALRSFHGRTLATLHATGQPEKHEAFQPLPEGFRHAAYDDVDAMEAALDDTVGAILVEAVQGEGGVNTPDGDYLSDLRALCDDRQLLLIVDEIQTGMARTGAWFAFQHSGVEPDIVTMAKGLGNGVPIGAVWARREVAKAFRPGDHGSTFAGQPLAAAAGLAVVETMMAMDAPEVARARGDELRSALLGLEGVADVRGLGLLIAAELTDTALSGRTGAEIASACADAGLLINGVTPTALRIAPPITVSSAEISEAVEIIDAVLRGDR